MLRRKWQCYPFIISIGMYAPFRKQKIRSFPCHIYLWNNGGHEIFTDVASVGPFVVSILKVQRTSVEFGTVEMLVSAQLLHGTTNG